MTSSPTCHLIFCSYDDTERSLVKNGLQDESYRLLFCASPAELAELIPESLGPTVLFLHLKGSNQNTHMLPDNIKRMQRQKRLAVLAVLPHCNVLDEETLEEIYQSGVSDIIYTPLRLPSLKTAFRVWIGRIARSSDSSTEPK